MMKASELWKMTVDDRVRSLLKSESSQKGKGKVKGKGKNKTFDPPEAVQLSTKTTMYPCLKIRLNK